MIARICAALLLSLATAPPGARSDALEGRPAFSRGEPPPQATATCENLRTMAEGIGVPGVRIDLARGGVSTLVRSDDALWYLVTCSDLRVMCATYPQNGMRAGDRVYFKGAHRRLDDDHAILDPCLAGTEAE